jgi:starvation-inducible DNA-binding protein
MYVNNKSIYTVAETFRKIVKEQEDGAQSTAAKGMLPATMRKVLANAYVLYYAAHASHWNVEGSNFPQYHTFFEKIYSEVYEELDKIAEQIRTINSYAPVSLKDLLTMTSLPEATHVYTPAEMLKQLEDLNNGLIASIDLAYKTAESAHEIGMSNYLQDLTDKQKKLGWMITSTLKGN